MRTRLTTGAVLAAAVALLAGSAGAASTVTIGSATLADGVATVSGTAAFDALPAGPVDVRGAAPSTGTAPALPAFAAAGVDLQKAFIEEKADGSGLVFTWKLRSLPASPPPEVTRYTWSFGIGDKTFQLQAKRSNVVTTTVADDPAGHAGTLASSAFQVRGNCTATTAGAAPVSSCAHLAFLKGAFDAAKSEVRIEVPFGLAKAPEIKPGAALYAVDTAGMSISAALQAAVSNTFVSTFINGWDTYRVGRTVEAGVGLADEGDAAAYVPAALTGSAFTARIPVESDVDTAFVRACQATTCTSTVAAPLG